MPAISRSRANSRTVTRMHRRDCVTSIRARERLPSRVLVVGIRRRALDPDVAALEVLVLPDRRDLLDALDRVAAGGKRSARCGEAAAITTLASPICERPDAVVRSPARARPCAAASAAMRSNDFTASGS